MTWPDQLVLFFGRGHGVKKNNGFYWDIFTHRLYVDQRQWAPSIKGLGLNKHPSCWECGIDCVWEKDKGKWWEEKSLQGMKGSEKYNPAGEPRFAVNAKNLYTRRDNSAWNPVSESLLININNLQVCKLYIFLKHAVQVHYNKSLNFTVEELTRDINHMPFSCMSKQTFCKLWLWKKKIIVKGFYE